MLEKTCSPCLRGMGAMAVEEDASVLASNFYTTCLWMTLQVSIRLGSPPAYPTPSTSATVVEQV